MDDVIRFYTEHPDKDRLADGLGTLEFARSKEVILRNLPEHARTVLDVGGGAGAYTAWLGEMGYDAHLIDITPSHIAIAKSTGARISSAEVGDARRLTWGDGSADVVLLLGPLYHLTDSSDRLLALGEARRVLRPGGVVFVSAITRFAPLLAALVDGYFDNPAFYEALVRALGDGQYRNTTGNPDRFTTAYFHRPEELTTELRAAGLEVAEVVAIEGPGWLATGSRRGFIDCWSDADRRGKLLELVRNVEHDPMSLTLSPHLLAVCRT